MFLPDTMVSLPGEEGKPLSELVRPIRRYVASGEIDRRVDDIPAILKSVEEEHAGAGEISHPDGLLVQYPTWWFNLRSSNTEPVLRLNLEAEDQEGMERGRDAILERIEREA